MLDGIGRKVKDALLDPLVRSLPRSIHPNAITVASLVPGVAAAVLAATGFWWWAQAAFWLNRGMDGLDGLVARQRGQQSDFGGYLDIVVDFVVYAAVPIGVWWGSGAPPAGITTVALVVLLAVFYVNGASWMYLSAVLEKRRSAPRGSTSVTMPGGLVEGTETVVFFTLFLALPRWAAVLFALMAAGTALGVAQRLRWARRHL
jgi:phosphatidylglycerophosphate synthase